MNLDSSRLLAGLATCFGVQTRDGGESWSADQFQAFVDAGFPVPLMINHEPLITRWGITPSIGTARRFAPVEYPVKGLLVLAEVDEAGGYGDGILSDIKSVLSQRWLPAAYGFSVAAKTTEDGQIWPIEVSITRRPAFADARILGVGDDALETWALLTEASASAA